MTDTSAKAAAHGPTLDTASEDEEQSGVRIACLGRGRPFVVNGVARRAHVTETHAWLREGVTAGSLAALDGVTQKAVASAWLDDARSKHASAAAFARFALQLFAVGAPASFLALTQQAMADEIEHAEACFSLASRHAGTPLGPGALEVTGCVGRVQLAEMAGEVVTNGCVQETLFALLAHEQAAVAHEPAVQELLERIADDEVEHAELAWRFVAWALEHGDDGVLAAVRAAFEQALTHPISMDPGSERGLDLDAFHAHGRLTVAERYVIARAARSDVIAPRARMLLAEHAANAAGAVET